MRSFLSILFLLFGVLTPHPIFSTTHNDWRLAGELEVGKKVIAYHSVEIKDLNNFLVGDVGVVVHNSYPCFKGIANAFYGTFTRANLGPIKIIEGTTKKGLLHIMRRHHPDFYTDLPKGDLFPSGTSLDEIIDGIKEVGVSGTRMSLPSNPVQTFEKVIKVHGERYNYRLIVDKISGEVVSFFKAAGNGKL